MITLIKLPIVYFERGLDEDGDEDMPAVNRKVLAELNNIEEAEVPTYTEIKTEVYFNSSYLDKNLSIEPYIFKGKTYKNKSRLFFGPDESHYVVRLSPEELLEKFSDYVQVC